MTTTSDPVGERSSAVKRCLNPDCTTPPTVYVGDLTTDGDWACSHCAQYVEAAILGDPDD